MAQSVIGALRVNLGLDSAQFHKGARGVEARSAMIRKRLVAVTAAATAMGAGLSAAALAGARQIDEAAKAARRLDGTIGGFRALEISASEAGVSLSGLTNDIQTMNRELASIGTTGNGARALSSLGLQISDLENLDADEKLARIADRFEALGLSAGQTTAILRDLGVRNREMALLVLQGGEAIRTARKDVRDYGLEISSVDASSIERANDQIGRLGVITQYVGQRLAVQIVPAFGQFAQAMTDSLREGRALRIGIDAILDGFQLLGSGAVALARNIDLLAGGVAILAATRLPALGASLIAVARTVSILQVQFIAGAVAARGLAVASAAASGALALLGGPAGVLAAGAAGLAIWIARSKAAETGAYDAAAGTAALLGELDVFAETAAPDAAKRAIDLANANRQLASSAFEAAKAELAKRKSMLEAARTSGANGTGGSIRDMGISESSELRKYNEQISSIERAEAALAQSIKDREVAAKALGITMSELTEADVSAVKTKKELSVALDVNAKGLGGAANAAKELSAEFNGPLTRGIEGAGDAFGDFVAGGLKDFKGFTESIVGSFASMISQLIATAAKNRILIGVGLSGGGTGAALASTGGSIVSNAASGGGGLLNSVLGGGFSGLANGLGGVLSGGGIASSFANLGGLLSGSVGGLGAIGAAIPAVGAIVLGLSAIIGKTTELDNGLRVSVNNLGTVVQSFSLIEKKRFFGLSKSQSTRVSDVSAAVSDPIANSVAEIQSGVMDMAATLGIGASAFSRFSFAFQVSLKDLSESDRIAAVQKEIEKLGDAFAGLVVPRRFQEQGEGAVNALTRLATRLSTVNSAMDVLGLGLFNVSVVGADAASQFVDLFGSLESFSNATSAYYSGFFSDSERAANATRLLSMELAALGIDALPSSHAAFRSLVEEADALGKTDLAASLIQLAPAFAEITAQSDALSESLASNALFRTAQDAQYARTAGGYVQSIDDLQGMSEMPDLLRDTIRAIREGDINNARISTGILNVGRRAALGETL